MRDDIPFLVAQIRVDTNAGCDLEIEGVTREALALMESLPWPGNVRELETVIRRAMSSGASAGWVEARSQPSLTWLQHEALRLAEERQEFSRGDFMARCGISRQVAGRKLAGLVRAGLLRQMGAGRGVRYVAV